MKLEKVLTRFCGETIDYKKIISDNLYSYATNGKIIVRVSRLENQMISDMANKWRNTFVWNHDDIKEWIDIPDFKIPNIYKDNCRDCDGTGVRICPACQGKGFIVFRQHGEEYKNPCKSCKSLGECECTCKHDILPIKLIEIYENTFAADRDLILLKDIDNIKISVIDQKSSPLLIKFDGGCGFLLQKRKIEKAKIEIKKSGNLYTYNLSGCVCGALSTAVITSSSLPNERV